MLPVLVVDDQPAIQTSLRLLFELHAIPVRLASTPDEALALVATGEIGAVVQDMNFAAGSTSGAEGVALFRRLRRVDPDLPVVLLTAWASLETAVALVKEGAADYLAKPWQQENLLRIVRNLLRLRELERENKRLRQERTRVRRDLASRHDLCGLVYASDAMHALVALAVQVARADVPVLITGPNGTGKEKIAEIVQANSTRRGGPFVRVDAGSIPDDLLVAELFGSEAGAFTGAARRRIGRFEAAHGGTLFLDEIANLSAIGQQRLLRVLQSGEYSRLGSSATIRADVRVLCATNADLAQRVAAGEFREDLYFRIDVVELRLPPLSQRPEDVLPLAEHFLAGASPGGLTLTPAARQALVAHTWPGNVREVQNRIRRAALMCTGSGVSPADLGLAGPGEPPRSETGEPLVAPADASADPDASERAVVERALREAGGVVAQAAAALGLSRQALYRRMERLGLAVERRFREDG